MPRSKTSPLDRILGRVDDLDATNLSILVQRLFRERKFLETIFNTIQDGILVIDSGGIVQYGNQIGLGIAKVDDRQIGKANLWKHMPELNRSIDPLFFQQPDPQSILTREVEISYPDLKNLRVYFVALEESFLSEEEPAFAVVFSDVTEEKVHTREKIESEKVKSIMMLAAGVAHELGNPLNSITIHLQLIQRELDRLKEGSNKISKKIGKSVAACRGEVERLDHIITHFLGAVRPRQPDLQDVNIIALLEEVLTVLEAPMQDRRLKVDVDIAGTLPLIQADPSLIKQVFFNIIKNAMEAMKDKGHLKIGSRADDEFVYIIFADSGEGISSENLAKVFEAYYTTKQDGHGLGMMVVQRIMRDHGGHIGIDSKPGVGTVVTLQFPQKHRRIRLLLVDPPTERKTPNVSKDQ